MTPRQEHAHARGIQRRVRPAPAAARGRGGGCATGPAAPSATVLRFFFALFLLASAVGKLLDNRSFASVVATHQVLPEPLLLPAALALSLVELALGLALVRGSRLAAAALPTVLLHTGHPFWLGPVFPRGLPSPVVPDPVANVAARANLRRDLLIRARPDLSPQRFVNPHPGCCRTLPAP